MPTPMRRSTRPIARCRNYSSRISIRQALRVGGCFPHSSGERRPLSGDGDFAAASRNNSRTNGNQGQPQLFITPANGCVVKWFLGGSKEDAGERCFAVPCFSSGWVRRDEVPHRVSHYQPPTKNGLPQHHPEDR